MLPQFLIIGLIALSQGVVLAASPKTVKSISVRYVGQKSTSDERILSRMSIKVGDLVSIQQINQDVKNLYMSGEVSNARILTNDVKGGVDLIVVVQANSLYGGSIFQGNTIFSTSKLSKLVTLTVNRPIDESAIRKARREIVSLYTRKGYPEVEINYEISAPNAGNISKVVFQVNEGSRGVLRRVRFTGNHSLPEDKLKEAMTQKEKGLHTLIKGPGLTDPISVAADVKAIENLYRESGFFEAQVVSVQKIPVDSKYNDLLVTIEEGKVYQVTDLEVSGIKALPNEKDLTARMRTGSGKAFSAEDLRHDIKMIEDEYRSRGYIDVRVEPYLEYTKPE